MMTSREPFPAVPVARAFYQRPTETVAQELLGKLLVARAREGVVAVRVSEVEAYVGPADAACHTRGGLRSARNRSMWGPAGHLYIYLIYGRHHCLNVVTVGEGRGEAVLVRGGWPVVGLDLIRRRRGRGVPDRRLCDGPGKLCRALGVTREQDGADVCQPNGRLVVADDGVEVPGAQVVATPRIGVGYAGEAAAWPLRFVWSRGTSG